MSFLLMKRSTLALLAASALALSACHKPKPAESAAQQARTVTIVRVEPRGITGAVAASGDLVPREEAAVSPEVNGFRVADVLVDVGSWVKKGQTLVRLDPALIQAQIAQQTAIAAQAAAQSAQAQDQANRVRDLDNTGVLSQEQIDQRRFQARAAQATAQAQAAALRDIKTRAGKFAVTAPVAGLVLEKTVRPGDISAVGGATPWFRLARDGQIELSAQLSEGDLARLRVGQAATVTTPSGAEVTGHIRLISPQIDAKSKLGEVRINLPVRSDIRAGGYARAVFGDATGAALAVPEAAVRYDADGASVMVLQSDNRVKRVVVQTGERGSGLVQLISGPPAGTPVVAGASSLLLDGDLVKPAGAVAPGPVASTGAPVRK
jgi:HlyD family secretion protein